MDTFQDSRADPFSAPLHWLYEGKERWEIARLLRISPRTVEEYLDVIYTALGVENALAASAAIRRVIEDDCFTLIEALAAPRPPRRRSRGRRR